MFCYLLVKSESLDNSLLFFEYLLLRNAQQPKKKKDMFMNRLNWQKH